MSNYRLSIQGTGGTTAGVIFHSTAQPGVPYVGVVYDQTNEAIAFRVNTGTPDIDTTAMAIMRATGRVGIGTIAPKVGLGSTLSLDVAGCVYGRLPVTVYTSSTALDLNTNFATYANSYIYLTNPGIAAVTLPTTTATTSGGTFFQLKNSTASYLSLTITNTLGLTSPVVIAPSNAVTFVVSPSNANTMLLF
jgi:hypothetical protein